MAVPESKRGEGKFVVLVKAEALARYTIQITANEKIFLPTYQRALTDDIVNQAKNAFTKAMTANSIKVISREDWDRRRNLQTEAIECCNTLLALIQLSHRVFHLKYSRIRHWGGLTLDVRNSLRAWLVKDTYRYSGQ